MHDPNISVNDKWLNINAVCNYTSLSASTVRRAVYKGALKASRITGKMLFRTYRGLFFNDRTREGRCLRST